MGAMTDPLQERVEAVYRRLTGPLMASDGQPFIRMPTAEEVAAAVLADLREAGELRTYEQAAGPEQWRQEHRASQHWRLTLHSYQQRRPGAVYAVREDTDE